MLYQLYMLLNSINVSIIYGGGEGGVTHSQVIYQRWSGRTEQTCENPQSCM